MGKLQLPKGEKRERERAVEIAFEEIMAKHIPNLMKTLNL